MPLKILKKTQTPNADTVATVTNQPQTTQPESKQSPPIDLEDTVNQVKPEEASIQRKALAESTQDSASLLSTESATAKDDDDDLEIYYKHSMRKNRTLPAETFKEMVLEDNERDKLIKSQQECLSLLLTGNRSQITLALNCIQKAYGNNTGTMFIQEFNAIELNKNRFEESSKLKPRLSLIKYCTGSKPNNPVGFRTVVIKNCEQLNDEVIYGLLIPLFGEMKLQCRIVFTSSKFEKVNPEIVANCQIVDFSAQGGN